MQHSHLVGGRVEFVFTLREIGVLCTAEGKTTIANIPILPMGPNKSCALSGFPQWHTDP